MTNAARAADVAVDRDIVGRVGKEQVGAFIAEKRFVRPRVPSIAAHQPMTSDPPHIAAARNRRVADRRNFIFDAIQGIVGSALSRLIQYDFDLPEGETGRLDFKAKIDQPLELNGEDPPIPAGVERQLVIHKDISLSLGSAKIGQTNDRRLLHTDQLSRRGAPVACEDLKIYIPEA